MKPFSVATIASAFALFVAGSVVAEPYFALREGLKCASCHVSTSGGGMRNTFGAAWGQTTLPAKRIELPGEEIWTGAVNRYIAVARTCAGLLVHRYAKRGCSIRIRRGGSARVSRAGAPYRIGFFCTWISA